MNAVIENRLRDSLGDAIESGAVQIIELPRAKACAWCGFKYRAGALVLRARSGRVYCDHHCYHNGPATRFHSEGNADPQRTLCNRDTRQVHLATDQSPKVPVSCPECLRLIRRNLAAANERTES